MNLLLFISALLTGLTGAMSSAQCAEAPAMHQSIAQAIEVAAEKTVQKASPERHDASAVRRPIVSILGASPVRVLKSDLPAIDIGRIYEKLQV